MPAYERAPRRWRLVALAMAAGAFLLPAAVPARESAAAGLSDVRGVDDLKQWFNAERGHARVILLLSPT